MADVKESQHWIDTRWHAAAAWQYLVVCLFDFLIAPFLMGVYSYVTGTYHPWSPLTLEGGGLYHVSMGAIVGVAVWSRGKEHIAQLNNNGDDDQKPAG